MSTSIDEAECQARSRCAYRGRVAVAAILIGTLLPIPRTSHAFDDERKGFIIGLGGGAGYCFGGQPDLPWRSNVEQNQFGGVYDGKIGYGWSRLSVFVDYRGAILSDISIGITGLGVGYYLSDHTPGLYFGGTLGASKWRWEESGTGEWLGVAEDWAEASGVGAWVGVGWEIWRHWSIESSVMWGNPTGDYTYQLLEHGEIDATFTALLVTINYVKY